MIALGIDTCGAAGSIALGNVSRQGFALLRQTGLAGKTYAGQLIPGLRAMLTDEQREPAAIEAIVVVSGPGSFTGIRIGISSAKGLAQALGIPAVAVSRLAVLSSKADIASAALDAGRGRFYVRHEQTEALETAAEAAAVLSPVAVCEDAVQQVFRAPIRVEPPTAADALCFASSRLLSGDFDTLDSLDGNYVRRPESELYGKALLKA